MLSNLELLNATEENMKWLNEHYNEIQDDFAENIVAIKDRKIIASAKTSSALIKILTKLKY